MSLIEAVSDVDNTFLSRREITCNFVGLGGKLKKLEAVEMVSKEFKLDGKFYFNNERFWEAHEAWEGVWKKCYGQEKQVIQGIILVAVAFAHSQKNDNAVGIGMFGRALEKIGDFSGMYNNIDVDRIKKKITDMQKTKELTIFQV